jgi:hypothetical protein
MLRHRYGRSHKPAKTVKVIHVTRVPESYSSSGFAYRAFRSDGTPLYIGAESWKGLLARLEDERAGRNPDFMPSYRVLKMPADFE